MALEPGARLGPYVILGPIGAGGMGEVHRARHVKLRRDVAIKVLPPELASDPGRLSRFEREARTASALNHPNIVTIHDIAEHEGTTFIAMELVEGRTVRDLVAEGTISPGRAIDLAAQVAEGLSKAHAAGIVHRDIKPANLMVTPDGLVKILDFGLAKPLRSGRSPDVPGEALTSETHEGLVVGTPHYMSPEQCSGGGVDHRSDQFALGVVLYEMVAGRLPFDGPSVRAIMSAILIHPPAPIRQVRPDAPAELERIIARCLDKDPDARYGQTAELTADLRALARDPAPAPVSARGSRWRPVAAATLGGAVLALAGAGLLWSRGAGGRWAQRDALAEITRLTDAGELFEAYRTALRAEQHRPDDPELRRLFERMTLPVAVNTDPPGAAVSVKGYATPDAPWEPVGVTPMTIRFPYAMMRWRITREGYEPFEGAPFSGATIGVLAGGLQLEPAGTRPPGMVRIPGGPLIRLPTVRPLEELPAVQLEPYHLDRYEVTNRQYGEFVRAGGYARKEWWPDPSVREGRAVPWPEAMRRFVDATGRPGPSTWEAGTWSAGEDEHPVGGISWYEAAAYCRYAGKSLPTVYHWFSALGQEQLSDILTQSNVGGESKAPVGRFPGLGGYGTYDMAGNVKEWAWNAAGEGRYILGGAWNEPAYLFLHLVAQNPLGREPTNGVRCAKYSVTPADPLTGEVIPQHEYDRPPALSDEAFAVVQGMYEYDRTPLDARVERVNDSLPAFRHETVSFRTAYGSDRMEVHLLMPRGTAPPYQPVIWFPGSDVFLLRSSEHLASAWLFDFIPRGGRVLVYPVYKGMYERFEPVEESPNALRDQLIRWAQDLGRTIDYLETRPDFDTGGVAYYGFSLGAIHGPVFSAVEPRITASILLGGGLVPDRFRPEVHPAALAPRSQAATLMINGRDDFIMPYELSQKPLFRLLGAPAERKRHARLDGGHIPSDRREIIREVLDWLDRQLGPLAPTAASATIRPDSR